jgi:hypothetical protein
MITGIDDIVLRLVNLLKDTNSEIIPTRGTIVHDGFMLTAASAYSWDSAVQAFSQGIQSLDQILILETDVAFQVAVGEALGISVDAVVSLLSAAIDRRGGNHGLTRKPASKAFSTIYFYTTTAPTENLTAPGGTVIEDPNGIQFVTTSSSVLLKDNLASYYDPSLLAYSIAVPCEALQTGPGSNVAANQLIYTVGPLPNGFSGVTNKYAVENGHNIETDAEFVDRIKTTLAGTSLQTADGMCALILNKTDIRSVFIADASSPYQIRNSGKGGVVDIYTIDNLPSLVTDQWPYSTSDQYFKHQPAIDVISVVGTYEGDPAYYFTEGVDYAFAKDANPLSMNSARAFDKIVWLTLVSPTMSKRPTGPYTVTYAYNQALETIQALVTQDQYLPLMGDIASSVLAREGTQVPLEIAYQVVVYGSYAKNEVTRQATANVTAYVNALGFGSSLSQSDIISVLENTPGIMSVNTVPSKFNRVGGDVEGTISVSAYEYLRAQTINVY